MQKILRLIARFIVERHECTYVRHCKENAPIYMYYVLRSTGNAYMMTSVIADCPDLAPPQYFGQVYAYEPIPIQQKIWDRPMIDGDKATICSTCSNPLSQVRLCALLALHARD